MCVVKYYEVIVAGVSSKIAMFKLQEMSHHIQPHPVCLDRRRHGMHNVMSSRELELTESQ